jgi:hypothetical protein
MVVTRGVTSTRGRPEAIFVEQPIFPLASLEMSSPLVSCAPDAFYIILEHLNVEDIIRLWLSGDPMLSGRVARLEKLVSVHSGMSPLQWPSFLSLSLTLKEIRLSNGENNREWPLIGLNVSSLPSILRVLELENFYNASLLPLPGSTSETPTGKYHVPDLSHLTQLNTLTLSSSQQTKQLYFAPKLPPSLTKLSISVGMGIDFKLFGASLPTSLVHLELTASVIVPTAFTKWPPNFSYFSVNSKLIDYSLFDQLPFTLTSLSIATNDPATIIKGTLNWANLPRSLTHLSTISLDGLLSLSILPLTLTSLSVAVRRAAHLNISQLALSKWTELSPFSQVGSMQELRLVPKTLHKLSIGFFIHDNEFDQVLEHTRLGLKILHLSNSIPSFLASLPSTLVLLEVPSLDEAGSASLPRTLRKLQTSGLSMTCTCLASLPPSLEELYAYRTKNEEEDALEHLPRRLKVLNLIYDKLLSKWPSSASLLPPDLESIGVHSQSSIAWSSYISHLQKLKRLDCAISGSDPSSVVPCYEFPPSLEYLVTYISPHTDFPRLMKSLPRGLKKLRLLSGGKSFQIAPESMGFLPRSLIALDAQFIVDKYACLPFMPPNLTLVRRTGESDPDLVTASWLKAD